jgi:hypothetical protein
LRERPREAPDAGSALQGAADGRFAFGHGKMGGRKKGSRLKGTMAIEGLFAGNAENVAKKVVAAAKAGENWAAKLVIERLLPVAKDAPITFKLGAIGTAKDAVSATQDVLAAVAGGGHVDRRRRANRRHAQSALARFMR